MLVNDPRSGTSTLSSFFSAPAKYDKPPNLCGNEKKKRAIIKGLAEMEEKMDRRNRNEEMKGRMGLPLGQNQRFHELRQWEVEYRDWVWL